MPQPRLFGEYTDVAGNFLRSSNWVSAAGGLAALQSALQAATNSNLLYFTAGTPTVGVVTPTDSLYPLATDVAIFNFSTSAGTAVRVTVPAPLASMFTPYGSVDAGNPAAAAVIAAVTGCLGDSAGNLASIFQGGSRGRRTVEQIGE